MSMTICRSECETAGRPIVITTDRNKKRSVVFMPNCGMWSCPHCAQERASEWKMNAWHGASQLMQAGQELAFVTLTARGGWTRNRAACIDSFKVSFPRLMNRVRYKSGGKVEYLAVPEQHKDGKMHMHLIIATRQSKHWWHDNAYKSGLGYQSDTKDMTDAIQAPSYVSKYLGKDFASVVWPKGFRRVRCSRGWPKISKPGKPKGAEYEAFMTPQAAWWAIYALRDEGQDVEIKQTANAALGL